MLRVRKNTLIGSGIIWLLYVMYSLKEYGLNNSLWRNGILLVLFAILGILYRHTKGKRRDVFRNEMRSISGMCILYVIISGVQAARTGIFSLHVFYKILQMWIPAAIAFLVFSIMTHDEIHLLIKGIFIITFAIYFMRIAPALNVENFRSIDILNSQSIFESNTFPGIAMGMFIYFRYFNKNFVFFFMSIIYTFLTFKRVNLLFLVILLFVPLVVEFDKKTAKIVSWIGIVISLAAVLILYQNLIHGSYDILGRFWNISLGDHSMGRNWMLLRILNSNYMSFGYYSSVAWTGVDIEMDSIRILLEMSFLGLAALTYVYVVIADNRTYLLLVSAYILVQLTAGHFLDAMYSWITLYLAIGMIKYYPKMESKNKQMVLTRSLGYSLSNHC